MLGLWARGIGQAVAIWIGVVSHWVLDWVTHRADMPLDPGGIRYGWGLWHSISGTMTTWWWAPREGSRRTLCIHRVPDASAGDLRRECARISA